MHAVVVQHEQQVGPGLLGPALEDAGFTLTIRFRGVEPADVDAELVVVLGGMMSACDLAAHPFLGEEVQLLTARLQRDAPCLGICLGAQLLAKAAGAEIMRGSAGLEVGATPVCLTDAGLADVVTGGGERELLVAHWHGDTFTPVPGATLLASSVHYAQQTFRRGSSYGFQFHPELSCSELRRWLDVGAQNLAARGFDLESLQDLAAFERTEPAREQLLARLARAFARAV